MKNIVRLGVAIAMAAALVVGFGGAASASGVLDTEVHVRACGPDAVDLWEDCHGNPVEGYEVSGWYLDDANSDASCETDANGNCFFTVGGANMSYGEVDFGVDEFIAVYCSSDGDNVEFEQEAEYLLWNYVSTEVDTLVVCDLYVYDEDASNSGAELPNTGAGVSEQGANLGLLLAGVVALGGLAVASRRAAVR